MNHYYQVVVRYFLQDWSEDETSHYYQCSVDESILNCEVCDELMARKPSKNLSEPYYRLGKIESAEEAIKSAESVLNSDAFVAAVEVQEVSLNSIFSLERKHNSQ